MEEERREERKAKRKENKKSKLLGCTLLHTGNTGASSDNGDK
jgi:hypothetical protein